MASSIVRAVRSISPSEDVRTGSREDSPVTRAIMRWPPLAPWIAASSVILTVVLSLVFGWAARPALVIDTSGFVVVAGLFVGALAIERLTELLIAPWVGALPHKTARSIVIGSVASVFGVLVAGGLGLYLLEIFTSEVLHTPAELAAAEGRTSTWLIRSLDVFVTGMAIAGGTKPLHDLISGLEVRAFVAKENSDVDAADRMSGGVHAPYAMTVRLPEIAQGRRGEVTADIALIEPTLSARFLDDTSLRLTGSVPYRAGSTPYVREVFNRAYRLAAAGYDVEPELAAPADVVLSRETIDPSPIALDRRWALDQMNLTEDRIAASGGGSGVKVGHPDTGYRPHRLRPNWDVQAGYDFVDDDTDALDPFLDQPGVFEPDFVPIPGHGTGTASIISVPRPVDGSAPEVYSVAPNATIIPYRVMRGPVHLFDSDVAEAVNRAIADRCDVISMSLGGFGFSGLRDAVAAAVDSGIIVVAAGGNLVGTVVSPADYPNTIAVASSTASGKPFTQGSSQGPEITITAPGTEVWRASFAADGTDTVRPGTGTSYAAAHVAGLAALWRGQHREALDAMDPANIPRLFAHLLRTTARTWPDDEDAAPDFGAGIVDGEALLNAPITGPDAPTQEDLDAALAGTDAASAVERTLAIGANIFTGEGTKDIRVGIISKLIGFLGAKPALGADLEGEALEDQRKQNLRSLIQREAEHHYRTDPAFRADLNDPSVRPSTPASATSPFAAVISVTDPGGDDAGPKSRELRRALHGRATIRGRYRWFGLLLLLVALAVAFVLGFALDTGDPLRITTSATVFIAAFYVAAQALERSVEFTFSRFVFRHDENRATERALILLGVTVAIGCVVAGSTGLLLLDLLAGTQPRPETDDLQRALSIFVTGLAIGGGTKPLHDLLTRIRATSTIPK